MIEFNPKRLCSDGRTIINAGGGIENIMFWGIT